MALVSSTIPNLIGGISQQPASIRLKTQGSAQVNAISDVVDGLQKRPGTEHIAKISTSSLSGAFIHALKRDEDEAYIVVFTGTGTNVSDRIKVFDKSGEAKTVNIKNSGDTTQAFTSAGTFTTDFGTDNNLTFGSAHGLSVGDLVRFTTATTLPAPLDSNTTYYVKTKTSTTKIILSTTSGGSELALTSNGSGTHTCHTFSTLYNEVLDYLAATTPQTSFAATTIADYTFVLNKTITVAKSATLGSKRNPEALVYIATGDYGTDYEIQIKKSGTTAWKSAAKLTTKISEGNNEKAIATNQIAKELKDDTITQVASDNSSWTALNDTLENATWLNTNFDTQSDSVTHAAFSVNVGGSVIHIQSTKDSSGATVTDGTAMDFDIQVLDSRGNVYTRVFKDQYPSFTRLVGHGPEEAEGMVVEITGDSAKFQDDFYVKFDDSKNGVWSEVVGPGLQNDLSASTMPIQLIKETDGTFSLKQTPWNARVAGDDETNEFPSFVGKKINDIFFHQNRLGVLADENVIFTESGEFYNWFSPTVLTSLETNPIDVAVSNNKVSILKHAVPFSESILIFSDLTQFIMKSSEYLSPTNVSLNVTTEFEADLDAKPVGAGRFVFFATDMGAHTGIREYFVEVDSETNDAVEITSHVPQYLDGNVKHMAASSNNDMLLVLTDGTDATKTMYVYRYFWQGTNKLQSAWSKFTFDSSIVSAEFLQDEIYMVVQRGSNVYLEKLKLSQDDAVSIMAASHPVHLDRRAKLTTTANFDNFSSTFYSDGNSTDYSNNNSVVYVSKFGEILGTTDTVEIFGTHTGSDNATSITDTSAKFQTNGVYNGTAVENSTKGTTGTINATVSSETVAATSLGDIDTNDDYKLTLNKIKQAITRDGFVYAGINYSFEYEFSEVMVRQGETDTPLTNGRLQIRNMTVLYSNTGFFTMQITASQRDADTYTFNGRITSDSGHTLNNTPLDTGSYRFPVLSRSSEVTVKLLNDTFLPCVFQSAEWEGLWHLRSQYIR